MHLPSAAAGAAVAATLAAVAVYRGGSEGEKE
jgi:hypothetical protein